MIDLSVIIPSLNEADALPGLLDDLARQTGSSMEIVVADGGSGDGTQAIAARRAARVVTSAPGRGRQMNAGAAAAEGRWLLFLHADSRLPDPELLQRALSTLEAAREREVAGHFPLRFRERGRRHRMNYRFMEEKSASNRRYTINGDQGLLLRRDWFEALGGFDESLGFLEDQRIAAAIHAAGRFVVLPGSLSTSARRFETEGLRARYILMAVIMAMYALDVREFFERAPGIYRAQSDTGRLLLTPFFRLLRQLMREFGWRRSARLWLGVGEFVLGQSWQLFFLADVAMRPVLRPGRYPCTAFHDRALAPLIHHRVGAWVTAALVLVHSMAVLAPWYRWRERRWLDRGRSV